MKKLSFLYVILVLLVQYVLSPVTASAQNDKALNVNVIVSDTTGKVLKDVAIYNSKQNLIGITNNFGTTTISARLGDAVVFSHISYEQKTVKISDENMLVILNAKTNILPEAEIVENVPHLAYNNKQVWVSDYKVNNAGMYLILDSNSEHLLIFLSHEQDTLARAKISKKYDYLYEDAFGNIHLLSKDTAYQTYFDGEKLNMLYPVDIQTFKQKLMPVQVITDSLLVLQRYASMWQEILYISVNRNNKETKVLADCYGPTREWGRTYFRDMQKDGIIDAIQKENPLFPNIMEMLGIEQTNTFGDDAIENTFVDFGSSQRARYRLQPIYSPIAFFNDTIYVFDLEKDKLIKFTENGTFVKDVDISFHRTTYRKNSRIGNNWDRNIIIDKALGKCYAQFSKDGHVTLKEIDLQTGTTNKIFELTHHVFPENIQIHNGIVYYKFIDVRQTVGRDCRSLYKMQLK